MSGSGPKKRNGDGKSGDPAGGLEALQKALASMAEKFNTPEARAEQRKASEEWRLRVEARYGGSVNEWERLYQRDRTFPEPFQMPEVPPLTTEVLYNGYPHVIPLDPSEILEIEAVIDALEEVRLGHHYDADSNPVPGVSDAAIKTLRTALRYCPEMIIRSLSRSPRNLAILATRRVAYLLGRGFMKYDPNEEITDSFSSASKAEILMVMELVCPNAWAKFLKGKSTRTLAKWWTECGLKHHPEDRGGPFAWEKPYREYFGIPDTIPHL
jgi:hypothetical protein